VITGIASEKPPDPDSFIGVFYQTSWEVIKGLMAAVNFFFFSQHDQHFTLLNNAHAILPPKRASC
jgi:hypothetical protein